MYYFFSWLVIYNFVYKFVFLNVLTLFIFKYTFEQSIIENIVPLNTNVLPPGITPNEILYHIAFFFTISTLIHIYLY